MRKLTATVMAMAATAGLGIAAAGTAQDAQTAPAAPLSATAAMAEPPNPAPKDAWQLGWVRGSVFYEVFVRSFADSNGDGVGDLPGLIGKLDYLNDGDPTSLGDLNVDAIWLMPIFESPSYHGYDVTDYEKIQPAYGTAEDFSRLIAEAHRRGMAVILDLPINHTSAQHRWFQESDASTTSAKRDWYVWRNDDPHWTTPWGNGNTTWHKGKTGYYYGVFWGGMPDLNFRTPAVRAEVERIAKLWLDRGVDGFRLDATRHLVEDGGGDAQVDTPETHEFLKEFSAAVRKAKPGALLVGENWTDAARIARYYGSNQAVGGGDELPMSFNFPLASAIVASVKAGEPSALIAALDEKAKVYPKGVLDAPFLTNHDMTRIATELTNDSARLKLAAAILLTLPGSPFVYYGEELGLQNGPGGKDEFKRTPMPWDATAGGGFSTGKPWQDFAPGREGANVAAQTGDPNSLLSVYRLLIRARHRSNSLRYGTMERVKPPGQPAAVLSYILRYEGAASLVVHNLSGVEVEAGPFYIGRGFDPLYASPGVPLPTGGKTGRKVKLPPYSSGVWKF